jgi:hypothetical protein
MNRTLSLENQRTSDPARYEFFSLTRADWSFASTTDRESASRVVARRVELPQPGA